MPNDLELHRRLIGQQGSRAALNTPALVIDRDALERNIAAMAAFAGAHAIALRPHAKTHKSVDIARLQLAAGALGVCCAKLGEAEALADGGVNSILITSPVVTPQAVARLAALHARMADLRIVADHPANVDALAAAARGAPRPLPVLVDIDPGIRRTGVASPEAAGALARRIADSGSLHYAGVQFYCGAQQHIESFAKRRAAIEERTAYLRGVVEQLAAAGLAPEMISGGGTGTHAIDAELGVLNELQVGSYVFMDRQYNDCDLRGQGGAPFETALFVDAHVISANSPGMATIDAGFKALSTDGGSPAIVSGAPADAMFVFMGDEHGALIASDHAFRLGDHVTLAAPHCDPTVNLYDFYHVVRGGALIDIWPVSARGRSR
jgi:D-serine deaminase-like pyridoxal phosphate-dependent protein